MALKNSNNGGGSSDEETIRIYRQPQQISQHKPRNIISKSLGESGIGGVGPGVNDMGMGMGMGINACVNAKCKCKYKSQCKS